MKDVICDATRNNNWHALITPYQLNAQNCFAEAKLYYLLGCAYFHKHGIVCPEFNFRTESIFAEAFIERNISIIIQLARYWLIF
jgi:hypothetical protein